MGRPKGSLNKRGRHHITGKVYLCDHCDGEFTDKVSLIKHKEGIKLAERNKEQFGEPNAPALEEVVIPFPVGVNGRVYNGRMKLDPNTKATVLRLVQDAKERLRREKEYEEHGDVIATISGRG